MKKLIGVIAFIMLLGVGLLNAQTREVTGMVADKSDGSPLPGVSVAVKGTNTGTATDINGKYVLKVTDKDILVFSFVGMKTQEILVGNKKVINVYLQSSRVTVEEVMVVAYGTAKKESFTGSAEMVSNEKLEKRTVSSVTKALEGTVAGVQTTSGGGQPGSGASIRIRGFGSINASSSPLYVVDGVPYDGSISAINPDDIQSISVLKDASASALYGARGANGVVIITTKKGSSKETVVRFKAVYGVTDRAVDDYETVNPKEYMELLYEAYKNQLIVNDGFTPEQAATIALVGSEEENKDSYMGILGGEIYNIFDIHSSELIDPATGKISPMAKYKYKPDWFDEATRDNPIRSDYQLSISGGTEKSQYLMSMGYLDEKGLVENSKFSRFTGRLNLDSEVKEWMKAGMSAAYSKTKQNYLTDEGTSYNNVWYSAASIAPIYPVYLRNEAGELILDADGKKQYDYGENRPYANNFNSIATLFDDSRRYNLDNMSGRTYFIFDTDRDDVGILKDLSFTMNFGFDYYHSNQLIYNNPYHGDGASVGGRGYKYSNRMQSYTINQLLNYKKEFGEHNLDVLVGHEFYKYRYSRLYGAKQGFPFGGVVELAAAAVPTGVTSYTNNYRVESYLSRVNYDYADKYYFSASFRRDGSSRFNKDYRWGDFWSLGGSWRVTKEEFMASLDWINNLTVKASYGEQGNDMLLDDDDPNYFAWQSFYSLDWPNNNMGGVMISSLENKEVEWEKNQNFNTGIEARIFDRVNIGLDYFRKKTTDLLLYRPKATSSGFNGYWDNVGDMVNKGIEVQIEADIFRNDFVWVLSTQFSHVENEVTKLVTDDQEIVSGSFIITKGKPINSFYLPKSAGIDPLTGKQLYWATIKEKGEDGKITTKEEITDSYNVAAANKTILGSRIPDLYGSITNNFSYKGFDLSVLMTYSIGGKVLDGVYSSFLSVRDAGGSLHSHLLRRWQKPGDVTDVPRLVLGATNQTTDRSLIDASYMSIKNVSLGYNFPKSITSDLGLNQLRIFVTGDNLFLFSKLKGMDPQYNFAGSQNYSYVPVRTLSLGVDVKF